MDKKLELFANFKALDSDDDEELIIEGLANSALTVDRMGDIVLQEAYEKGGLDNYNNNSIILFNHNYSDPIGKALEVSSNTQGLYIKAKISKAAGKTYELIKEGILKAFSIGFRVLDADYDSATDLFVIKDLELYEVSVVSIPANQDSLFSVAKQLEEIKKEYKQEFISKQSASVTDVNIDEGKEVITPDPSDKKSVEDAILKEKQKMNEEELKAQLEAMKKELDSTKGNLNAAEDMLDDVAKKEATEKAEKAEKSAKIAVKSQVEDLVKEVEARFLESTGTMSETIKGLESSLKEKSEEIAAITRNKMSFQDAGDAREAFTKSQRDDAVLVSKILGRDIKDTKFYKEILQKSGLEHTPSADWEQEFSTTIFNAMKDKLVLEPLFQTLKMNTPSMQIPINPEAGLAEWVSTSSFRSTDGSSTGTAVDHKMGETTLVAHKLASKEFIGYEEEEDTILSILPIIRDAVTRRMARTSDQSLLRGTGLGTGGDAVSPFEGLTAIAADAGKNLVQVAVGAKVTVDDLQATRRQLGAWGLNPGDVKYIVSQDAYYDLLEDPDFRTMDLVGDRATVIKGQIGSVNGSPVIVSDSYLAKAIGTTAVTCVYTGNFYVGNLRTMMVEKDKDIINQKNVIVATRRMGFIDMIAGEGAATLEWIA